MSIDDTIQAKGKEERKEEERRFFFIDEQIAVLKEFVENPDKRGEIMKRDKFRRAYDIFISMEGVQRGAFYGEANKELVDSLLKLRKQIVYK